MSPRKSSAAKAEGNATPQVDSAKRAVLDKAAAIY